MRKQVKKLTGLKQNGKGINMTRSQKLLERLKSVLSKITERGYVYNFDGHYPERDYKLPKKVSKFKIDGDEYEATHTFTSINPQYSSKYSYGHHYENPNEVKTADVNFLYLNLRTRDAYHDSYQVGISSAKNAKDALYLVKKTIKNVKLEKHVKRSIYTGSHTQVNQWGVEAPLLSKS